MRRKRLVMGIAAVIAVGTTGYFVYAQHSQPGHGHGQHGGFGLHGEKPKAIQVEEGKFPVVGFEQTHVFTIPFSIDQVQPLYEPRGRSLIYEWWEPATILREAEGDTLKGMVTVSNMHEHDIFLIVTEHKPEDGHIQYLVLWDDFELQRIDITCEEGETPGSTKVTWTERNAGLHENGVEMVSMFAEDGHLERVVQRYADNTAASLRGED